MNVKNKWESAKDIFERTKDYQIRLELPSRLIIEDDDVFYMACESLVELGILDKQPVPPKKMKRALVQYKIQENYLNLPKTVRRLKLEAVLRVPRTTLGQSDLDILKNCTKQLKSSHEIRTPRKLKKRNLLSRTKKLVGLELLTQRGRVFKEFKTSDLGIALLESLNLY